MTTIQAQLPQHAGVSSPACSAACRTSPTEHVGDLTDDELESRIDDLSWSWRVAYDRYQQYSLPADRDEALVLLQLHNRAVLARSPAAQAARWAEINRAIDEQCNYFGMRGDEARQSVGAR